VDDLEDQVAALTQRGLSIGAIGTVPGMVRKVVLIDPEGNRITLGADLRTS
jgi:predicted enzyme related to lactoylglutathione lyase